jgi:hypothetical protein
MKNMKPRKDVLNDCPLYRNGCEMIASLIGCLFVIIGLIFFIILGIMIIFIGMDTFEYLYCNLLKLIWPEFKIKY